MFSKGHTLTHFSPTSPTVSVLMPVHDAEKTLRRALASFENQTLANIELVAVDAGSEDTSARQLDVASERDIRIVVEHLPRCGRSPALERALELARGEYIAVMDADGWFEPTYLAKLVGIAQERPVDLVVAGLSAEVVSARRTVSLAAEADEVSYPTQHEFRSAAWKHFASGQAAPASGKLFLRSKIEETGARFDPDSATDHGFTIAYLHGVERPAFAGAVYRVSRDLGGAQPSVADAVRIFAQLEAEYESVRDLFDAWGLAGDAKTVEMLQSRYLEVLSLCVEMAALAPSADKGDEAKRLVARMLSSERALLAASVAQPRDNAARALVGVIKSQNVSMAVVQARLLSLLRRGAPPTLTPDAFL